MHELAISEAIVAEICDRVDSGRVVRVVLEVGTLCAVEPRSVQFCFDLAAQGSVVEGAALEIVEIPGEARCRRCDSAVALEPGGIGMCAACGGLELDVVGGLELRIQCVEVI